MESRRGSATTEGRCWPEGAPPSEGADQPKSTTLGLEPPATTGPASANMLAFAGGEEVFELFRKLKLARRDFLCPDEPPAEER